MHFISYKVCGIQLNDYYVTLSWLNLFNSIIVPFFCMTFMSVLLIYKINKVRLELLHLTLSSNMCEQIQRNNRKKRKRDIRFGVIILLLNVSFIFVNIPICVYLILAKYDSLFFLVSVEMAFTSTCIPFFVDCSNGMFRNVLAKNLYKMKT